MAAEPATEKPVDPTPAATGASEPAPGKPRRPSRAGFGRRLTIGTNVLIQIVLAAAILLFINGYAFKHYHRFDLSRNHRSSLSDRTRQFLRGLDKPVKIIVLINRASPIQDDVANLAAEYRNAQSKYVTIDIVDPFHDYTRATELQTKYKLGPQENVVVLDSEGRTKVIGQDKMAEIDPGNEMTGQAPQVTGFTGEQAITSGLIEVTEGKKSTVYYVQGHGEPSLAKGKPLATIGEQLEAEHLTVADFNLLNADAVPADATVVLLIGPHYDLTDREIKLLSDYWDKGGRLFILLNPDFPTPHLAGFLTRLGVRPDDDRVLGQANVLGVRKLFSGALTLFRRRHDGRPASLRPDPVLPGQHPVADPHSRSGDGDRPEGRPAARRREGLLGRGGLQGHGEHRRGERPRQGQASAALRRRHRGKRGGRRPARAGDGLAHGRRGQRAFRGPAGPGGAAPRVFRQRRRLARGTGGAHRHPAQADEADRPEHPR